MTKHAPVSVLALFCTLAAVNADTLLFTDAFELKVQNDGLLSTLGADVPGYFIDGGTAAGDSAHAYDFIRFENLFGSGPGQIPEGATILDASLTMWTAVRSNAQSGGPFGVAPLLAPFAATNVYSDYSGSGVGLEAGPSYFNQHTGRPAGGFSALTQGNASSADVTLVLQQWTANPTAAFGFAIQPRTTDGWYLETTGSSTVEHRPSLTVNYTTVPTTTFHFQQDMNAYTGTTTALLDANGTTTNGAILGNAAYVDGPNAAGDSRDIQALLKFDNLFGTADGQIKPGETILRAYLVLTTGSSTESHSGGMFDVHQMLVDWDTTSTFSTFGGDGPTVEQNEIGLPLSTVHGMTQNSQALFDVTDAVRSWQSGAGNFGLNVQSNTTDGWNIFFSGAANPAARPELVVVTGVPEPGSAALVGIAACGLLGLRRRRA
ncbi:MAG: putative serine/threonine phosphatase [Chthoniobacteraceae bacterium]|nr:putative serine/threonine phosphatase [Chthoniobacteraceae bacterium]